MKKIGLYYILLIALISAALLVSGCAEVDDDFRMPAAAELKVHEEGFEDPESENFHGFFLRDNDWDWRGDWPGCEQCHGSAPRFEGGTSNVSCATSGCHVDFEGNAKTLEDCNTCHGDFRAAADDFASFAPPRDLNKNTDESAVGVGVHQIHLRGGEISTGIRCNECHVVPQEVFVENHLEETGPDKVVFNQGDLASFETRLADMTANPPTYNPDVAAPTCDNTYCHGNFSGGNKDFAPIWTVVDGSQSECGTCHGDPETGNPLPTTTAEGGPHIPGVFNCQACHWQESDKPIARRLEDGSYFIEQKDLHIDGAIYITGERRTDW